MSIKIILEHYQVKQEYIQNDDSKTNYINNYDVFVINLDSNKLRRQYIKVLMKKLKINFNLLTVTAVSKEIYDECKKNKTIVGRMNIAEMGCCLSHLWCLNYAVKNNIQNFVVFEDDIIFHKNFHELFEDSIENQNHDLLMLGACDFKVNENIKTYNMTNGTYKPLKNAFGGHANFYSLKFAKDFLNQKLSYFTSYDCDYSKLYNSNYNVKICYPNLVVCELSTTNLEHDFSYENNVKENYYYKACFTNKFCYSDYYFIYLNIIQLIMDNKHLLLNYDSYEKLIEQVIDKYDNRIKIKIKPRLCYDFFTLEDIKEIVS